MSSICQVFANIIGYSYFLQVDDDTCTKSEQTSQSNNTKGREISLNILYIEVLLILFCGKKVFCIKSSIEDLLKNIHSKFEFLQLMTNNDTVYMQVI